MSYYEPPSEGSKRCMIYRTNRVLNDGCDTCSKSATLCGANRALNNTNCCNECSH